MHTRAINATDIPRILELNAISVHYLSPLDSTKLGDLLAQAIYNSVYLDDDVIAAFMIAFDQTADYKSPNYAWFCERYRSFVYIDRIVVAEEYRRKGIADVMYDEVTSFALKNGYQLVTCEVDSIPPNPASLRFHEKHQFKEVGKQWLYNGQKQVLLLAKKI